MKTRATIQMTQAPPILRCNLAKALWKPQAEQPGTGGACFFEEKPFLT
jgi:hypothetical protein